MLEVVACADEGRFVAASVDIVIISCVTAAGEYNTVSVDRDVAAESALSGIT